MKIADRISPVEVIRIFENSEDIPALAARMNAAPYVSIDTEWFAYDNSNDQTPVENGLPFCLTAAWWEPKGMVASIVHNYGDGCWHNLDRLQDTGFFGSEQPKIAHNYPVDWHVLRNAGIELEGPAWDTLVLSHMYNDNRGADWNRRGHGLKECVEDYSGVARLDFKRVFGDRLLKKNGEPYASDKWIVPGLELWWERLQELPPAMRAEKIESYIAYATEDATDALWLFEMFKKSERLNMPWDSAGKKTMFDFFLQKKAEETRMICDIERVGMPLDLDFMDRMAVKAERDKNAAEEIVCEVAKAPIKMTSAPQLAHLVYGHGPKHIMKGSSKKNVLYTIHGLGYPVVPGTETDTGGPSVSYDAIKALRTKLEAEGHPVPRMLSEIQRFARAASQHRKMLEIREKVVGDRIHGRINQVGTTSGRWSSSNPNLQNIVVGEKDMYNQRDAFAAQGNTQFWRTVFVTENGHEVQRKESFVEDGVLVVADFSQLEYRLLAHFSQDPTLLAAFRNGWDMHSLTTLRVFSEVTDAYKKHFGTDEPNPERLEWVAENFNSQRKKGKCVHPDTLVTFNGKLVPMRELVGDTEPGAFRITPSMSTIADGRGGERLVHAVYNNGEDDLYTVASRRGVIVCRGDHKILTTDGRQVRALDLLPGEGLVEADVPPLGAGETTVWRSFAVWQDVPEASYALDVRHAYLAGMYQGDGTISGNSVTICHGSTRKKDFGGETYAAWQETVAQAVSACGLKAEKRDAFVYIGSRVAIRWFQALGLVESDRFVRTLRVPSWVMELGREGGMHFLGGLADTDGYMNKIGQMRITTKDPVFAGQIATLASACGLGVYVEPTWNDKYQRFYWNVRFTTESSFDLSKYMRHTSKVGRARPAQRRPFKSENTVVFVQFYGRGPCCDVNLDGDHLYQANTFVTHNTLNFEIIYGVGAKTLALQLGIKDSAAQSMIDGWFRAYPRVRLWMDSGTAEAKRIGYGRTLAGRYRWPDKGRITGARGRSAQGEEERTFANSRVQGSAADMTSQSMLLLRKDRLYLGTGARIIAQVHDEVVVESPWTQADLVMERMRILMEQPFSAPLRVPMPVSIGVGPSWATSKLLKAVVVV